MNAEVIAAFERLVGPLDDDARAWAEPALRIQDVPPGHAITHEGAPPRHMVLLLEGRARLSKLRPDGAQEVVAYVLPVALLGHASVVGRDDYLMTAMAVDPSRCLFIAARLLRTRDTDVACRVSIRLMEAAVLGMSRQLRAVNARLLSLAQPGELVDGLARDLGSWVLPDPT